MRGQIRSDGICYGEILHPEIESRRSRQKLDFSEKSYAMIGARQIVT